MIEWLVMVESKSNLDYETKKSENQLFFPCLDLATSVGLDTLNVIEFYFIGFTLYTRIRPVLCAR